MDGDSGEGEKDGWRKVNPLEIFPATDYRLVG